MAAGKDDAANGGAAWASLLSILDCLTAAASPPWTTLPHFASVASVQAIHGRDAKLKQVMQKKAAWLSSCRRLAAKIGRLGATSSGGGLFDA